MLSEGRLEEIESLEQQLDVDRPPTAMEIDLTFKAIEELLADRAELAAEVERLVQSSGEQLARWEARYREATKAGTPYWHERDTMNSLVIRSQQAEAEVGRLNGVIEDLLRDQRFALHELLPERERLKDEVARLRAAVATLAGVCRGVVARLESWSDAAADEGEVYRGVNLQALANQLEAALAAAEPRPGTTAEGTAR